MIFFPYKFWNREVVEFLFDGKFYFFWHGMDTYPIKSDGTLGPKVKDRVKVI